MDRVSKVVRSRNMSAIKSSDTEIELLIRHKLYADGYRYKVNHPIIGRPDIVLSKHKICIFINGCFWHQHGKCKLAKLPKSNVSFWKQKLDKNKQRDLKLNKELDNIGWHVFTVWECDIKNNLTETYSELNKEIKSIIYGKSQI